MIRVCVTSMPLMAHLTPLRAIAAELIRRKIDVTFAAFDTIIDRDNHVNIRQVLPPDMQIIPLGEVDPGFGPYAATEAIAKTHRRMHQRLTTIGRGFDVWLVDTYALGALAAAEDLKSSLVAVSPNLPSELIHSAHVFGMTEMFTTWPVLLPTVSDFDPPMGDFLQLYGAYPPSFRFVGSLSGGLLTNSPSFEGELQKWFKENESKNIVYVSLSTVSKINLADLEEMMKALSDAPHHPVLWSMPEEHRQKLLERGNVTFPSTFHVTPWVPQQAVLSHPSVIAFVSHCGISSMEEAIVAKVPLICVPQAGDQVANARQVVRHRLGRMFAPSHTTSEDLGAQVKMALDLAVLNTTKLAHSDQMSHFAELLTAAGGAGAAADIVQELVRNSTNIFAMPEPPQQQAIPRTASF